MTRPAGAASRGAAREANQQMTSLRSQGEETHRPWAKQIRSTHAEQIRKPQAEQVRRPQAEQIHNSR